MVAGAAAGELVDQGAGSFGPAEMRTWGEQRTVRAPVLQNLLVAGQWPVHAKGIRLRGVRISGHLDLEGAALRCPLLLESCYLDADEPTCLDHAEASRVALTGCQLAGLTAEMLTAKSLNLSRSVFTDVVRLAGADIAGQLNCTGAQLTIRDEDGNALVADGLRAADVFLTGGFAAAGAVRLAGADIAGLVACRGARLAGDNDGVALVADGLKAAGHVFLDRGFTATGSIRLPGAQIAGQLNCGGAQLTGRDDNGAALVADGLTAGAVLLYDVSTTVGAVRLPDAEIAGELNCRGAQLTGRDDNGVALVADGLRATRVFLDKQFTTAGAVRLPGADIAAQLSCGSARFTAVSEHDDALVASGMTVHGDVFLDGGFAAAGVVRLHSAKIAGQLNCSGAQLTGRDDNGAALLADRLKAGSVFLDKAFTTAGAVRLAGAEIAGELSCAGAQLTGRDSHGTALFAERLKASGAVRLTDGFTAAGIVRLTGADIAGQLNCGGAQLTGRDEDGHALVADGLKAADVLLDDKFTAAGMVRLNRAVITGRLDCGGARLTAAKEHGYALSADGLKAALVSLHQGFTAVGAVWLHSAEVTVQLSCLAARLTGRDDNGAALVADGLKASSVFLDKVVTTAGAVRLRGADIRGPLSCRGAQLAGRDEDGTALVADGLKAADVFLTDRFAAAGAVRLHGATITGQLNCRGAQITAASEPGGALLATGMTVDGDVLLDKGFTAAGRMSLTSARIGGSINMLPGKLAEDGQEMTFDASGAQITGTLRWAPLTPVGGRVDLEGTSVGEVDDDWSGERANGYWPTGGRLRLDGFTYGRFSGDKQADVEQRLAWIRSQHHPHAGDSQADFAAQPYEQLAAVYRQAGRDTDARKVAIARRADLRKYGELNRYRRVGNWLLDITIRYGYETWRAGLGLAAVFVIFLAYSFLAQQTHLMVPVGDTDGLHYLPSATKCTSSYPCFYPFGYTIDTVIPLINVHQAAYWGPDGHTPWGHVWVVGTWLATGLGWALATLLVAGYTGLVRQD
jgi:hypothetical protein